MTETGAKQESWKRGTRTQGGRGKARGEEEGKQGRNMQKKSGANSQNGQRYEGDQDLATLTLNFFTNGRTFSP